MPRVKRGTQHTKRRRSLLSRVKGFKWGRKNRIRLANQALMRAGQHAFRDRRNKKREFRRLWNTKISAAAKLNETTYSRLIHGLKTAGIELDRKVLADIAEKHPEVFTAIVKAATK